MEPPIFNTMFFGVDDIISQISLKKMQSISFGIIDHGRTHTEPVSVFSETAGR